jgi:hypothetical protein
MRFSKLFGLLLILGFANSVRADGLVYQLPADGMQARYDMELAVMVGGQEMKFEGWLTVSSVGQAVVDNEKCRWIEIKMVLKEDAKERVSISKALIPEQYLAKGKSPAEKLIRAWVQEPDMPAVEIKDLKDPRGLAIAAYLFGPPKNHGELEPVEIDNPKLGKVNAAGVTGDVEIDGPVGTQLSIKLEDRLHEKTPFGLVTANWKFDLKANGQSAVQGTFKLKLTEINTTALTELPDKN